MIHTAEEWEQRRELITRLYSREGKTLKEVRRMLAEDGFRATPRMFKQRIRAWKIDKNNKECEMKAILRITQRRKSIGKDTVCHLRGRTVNAAEVNRYFSRKGITDVECGQGEEATPPEIRVSTPVDEILASAQTPRPLALPDSLQPFQIVGDQIRNYIWGTYESKWQFNLPLYNSRDNCEILDWRTWLFDAMDLIEVGKGAPALTLLNKVYDRVALVLREQHPSLLGEILEVASTYKRPSQLQFREQLVQFLFRMAAIVLGPTHALTRLLRQLLDPLLRASLVDVAMRQALSIFQSTFGASHEQTLVLHCCSACVMWETAAYDKAASTYRHVTSIRDQKHQKRSPLSCWADIAEAEFLRGQQRYDQAKHILEEVCQRARYIESSDHVAQIMYALRSLCEIHRARGNVGMACALQRRAVELSQKYLEIDHVATEVAIWYQEGCRGRGRVVVCEEGILNGLGRRRVGFGE
jgi:tetratricopeptide (TPR) repeat protein